MCECNKCNKKDTENCIRIIESVGYGQREIMHQIEMDTLKQNYNNLLKGVEKIIQTMASETFWKVRDKENEDYKP